MKQFLNQVIQFSIFISIVSTNLYAQNTLNKVILIKLDSIAKSESTAKYFAKMYYNAIVITNRHLETLEDSAIQFFEKFERAFVTLFMNEVIKNGNAINATWQSYFEHKNLIEIQYYILGINAHINNDLWLAFKNNFDYYTLKTYKKPFMRFQKSFNIFFDSMYTVAKTYKPTRRLQKLSFGTGKLIGKLILRHWRHRQIKLAILWHKNQNRFANKWDRVQKRKNRLDVFALKLQ